MRHYSASMRTRVAIAAAIAAAAVVATLVVLTSIALANNDVEQLDRRLDAIVAASVYAGSSDNSQQTILTTGRSASNGQVVFQKGFQLPPLPATQRRMPPGRWRDYADELAGPFERLAAVAARLGYPDA